MEGIKYENLIEIGPVVVEMWGVENGELAVSVNNNTLVCHTAFLAADTQPCVLILLITFFADYFAIAKFLVKFCDNIFKCDVKADNR